MSAKHKSEKANIYTVKPVLETTCIKQSTALEAIVLIKKTLLNLLPHMPILRSSTRAANKDMMSKILTNGDTIF